MASYQELRERALALNQKEGSKHPCVRGNGACCEPDIQITADDALNIRQSAMKGLIPLNVIQDAKKRVRNKNRQRCAFLGDDNECSIYEFRPLVCIITGTGGKPRTEDVRKAVDLFKITGKDTEISCTKVTDASCVDCFKSMSEAGFKYNASSIGEFDAIVSGSVKKGILPISRLIRDLPSGR